MMDGFTPIERALALVLQDGMPHSKPELFSCLGDPLASMKSLRMHISNMRKKLRPRGQDIICELYKANLYYRHVILLASATDGKR